MEHLYNGLLHINNYNYHNKLSAFKLKSLKCYFKVIENISLYTFT